ncbi:MAG: Two-component sensor histidine kinase [uncultured Sulfurovum sp.]|uniref:histidine kinase n=1 Tax=uncultured Sulfurovum sp. TaxID=269237 RepID=A0A6S6SFB2_9BACT|nr:MAG: Two-component sensor histidine kinase [uncultured Sulfurovum sp.]
MGILLGIIFYLDYQKELQSFDEKLFYKMHLCSYSLDCQTYKIDFEKKKENVLYKLLKNKQEVSSLYPVKDVSDFYLKLSLSQEEYHEQMHYLHEALIFRAIVTLVVAFLISMLFSFYALYPLRNALVLTREFIKDILHDFNTPIATMRLNLSLLEKEIGSNTKVSRIERSIENILSLEENLKNYLQFQSSEIETFNLLILLQERINMVEQNYPHLRYSIEVPLEIRLHTFKKDFVRIVDNIIINASKYNKSDGQVLLKYDEETRTLSIEDTGKGIKNPKKVFERFYKEHERGVGIGLHIVKKLTEHLNIQIELETLLGKKTIVLLKLPFEMLEG